MTVNGRKYRLPPHPVAVICLDGCADEYLTTASTHRGMPNLERISQTGYRGLARGALPSFTNVNNCSIITGTPPAQTGISGNYVIDPGSGMEVMLNEPGFLRNTTLLSEAARAGRKVAMVTAKEKLRRLLAKDLQGIAFSSEKASEATKTENGIGGLEALFGNTPDIYSGEASLYVLRAGIHLIEQQLADFLYLTTTDFMQHRYPPEAPEMLNYHEKMDTLLGRLADTGAVIGITADHGMNAKSGPDGRPNAIFLESLLQEEFGPGFKVICPITDPYVVHHGAMGSAVMVYCPKNAPHDQVEAWICNLPGVTEVHDAESAVSKLELPADRMGDFVVLSGRDHVIGRTKADHDLSQLRGPLRSHGGRYEEMVPFILSHPLTDRHQVLASQDPRNFDIFDFVCNGTELATPVENQPIHGKGT
ncbi:MAG: phosphonoacetate hydrolase [Puniceicoccaceae bacterium]